MYRRANPVFAVPQVERVSSRLLPYKIGMAGPAPSKRTLNDWARQAQPEISPMPVRESPGAGDSNVSCAQTADVTKRLHTTEQTDSQRRIRNPSSMGCENVMARRDCRAIPMPHTEYVRFLPVHHGRVMTPHHAEAVVFSRGPDAAGLRAQHWWGEDNREGMIVKRA